MIAMKQINITKGNDFAIYVPVVLLTSTGVGAPDMALLNIDSADIVDICGGVKSLQVSTADNNIVLDYEFNTLPVGAYSIVITGTYEGRAVSYKLASKLNIVDNDEQSNWSGYLQADRITLDTQFYIAGAYLSDEEIERLKAELQTEIIATQEAQEAARVAKAEADETAYKAVQMLEGGLAQQGTNPLATNTAIYDAVIQGGGGSFPTDYAREDTLQAIGDDTAENFKVIKDNLTTIADDVVGCGDTIDIIDNTTMNTRNFVLNVQSTTNDILQAVQGVAGMMYKGEPAIYQTANVVNILPNQRNIWGVIDGSLTCNLVGGSEGITNEYILSFTAGEDFDLTINTTAQVRWAGGNIPEWTAGNVYEISIIVENNNALILWAEF